MTVGRAGDTARPGNARAVTCWTRGQLRDAAGTLRLLWRGCSQVVFFSGFNCFSDSGVHLKLFARGCVLLDDFDKQKLPAVSDLIFFFFLLFLWAKSRLTSWLAAFCHRGDERQASLIKASEC